MTPEQDAENERAIQQINLVGRGGCVLGIILLIVLGVIITHMPTGG